MFEKLVEIINKLLKERFFWSKVFSNAGKDVLKLFDSKEDSERLASAFSSEYLQNLSTKIKQSDSQQLVLLLKSEIRIRLHKLFTEEESNRITDSFVSSFRSELQANFPELGLSLDNSIQKELLSAIDQQIAVINTREQSIKSTIDAIKGLVSYFDNIRSLDEEDKFLHEITTPYCFGLDFFDFDDKDFTSDMAKSIDNPFVYIQGRSREETLYCVCEELFKLKEAGKLDRPVLIVLNNQTWQTLSVSGNVSNSILIPFFYAETIEPIRGHNTNVFVFSEDEQSMKRPIIKLKRRLQRNFERKIFETFSVPKISESLTYACSIFNETHGMFELIKRKFFNGSYPKPKWYGENAELLKKILLVGCWTETDSVFVQKIIGKSYLYFDFKNDIKACFDGDDPFIICILISFSTKCYSIANFAEAWNYLGKTIDHGLFKEYCNDVAIPFVSYSDNQEQGKCPSSALRNGILKNLFFAANQIGSDEDDSLADMAGNAVQRIFDSFDFTSSSLEQFCLISELAVEVSPSRFLLKIEAGINSIKSLLQKNQFTEIEYLNHLRILRALEKLLWNKDYVNRVVRLLFEINDLQIKTNYQNSAFDTLRKVFSAWAHQGATSEEQLKKMAQKMMEQHELAWDVFFSLLPRGNEVSIGSLACPQYIPFDDGFEGTNESISSLYKDYIGLCIEHSSDNPDRIAKLIESDAYLYFGYKESFYNIIRSSAKTVSDPGRKTIQDALREKIYKCRSIGSDTWWKLPDKVLDELEGLYKEISFVNPLFGYLYLFEQDSNDFQILHPEPVDFRTFAPEYHQKIVNKVKLEMEQFKKQGLDLKELLKLIDCKFPGTNLMGGVIAEVYSPSGFDLSLFKTLYLLKSNKNTIWLQYVEFVFEKSHKEGDLLSAISIINEKDDIVKVVELCPIGNGEKGILSSLGSNIQDYFWKNVDVRFLRIPNNKENIDYCIEELERRNRTDQSLFLISMRYDLYSAVVILALLKKAALVLDAPCCPYLLIGKVYKELGEKEEYWKDIACVEMHQNDYLNLRITPKFFAKEPEEYSQIINFIYKHRDKDGKEFIVDLNDSIISKRAIDLFAGIKFCPGCLDGKTVCKEIFDTWVAKFKKRLEEQGQDYVFDTVLGRLLAHSPVGRDGIEPDEAIRSYIETHFNDDLGKGYLFERMNRRGIHIVDDGDNTNSLAIFYKEMSDKLEGDYPHLSSIYSCIADEYTKQSKMERANGEIWN